MENDTNSIQPAVPVVAKPTKSRSGWKIFLGIIIGFSIAINGILFLSVIGLVGVFSATKIDSKYIESVIESGDRSTKIAVIDMQGFIGAEMSEAICDKIDRAEKDKKVKAVILRVDSPGGTISDSDRICQRILDFKEETSIPVIAFMRSIAASGGYYCSVACDEIVSEPTAITGSIGVIMNYFVFQELLEEKVGINPITIKSCLKKDWPSPFQMPTEEQIAYLKDGIITPAYERFVKIVADNRKDLSLADARRLADGSIYNADKALQEKLIDEIGYIDSAIDTAAGLAGIEDPHVIEYELPLSLAQMLTECKNSGLELKAETLYELAAPKILSVYGH